MANSLCDELLQEIFLKLPSSSSSSSASSITLVSKRWLNLYRSSRTSISLRFNPQFSLIPSFISLLNQHTSLSSLSLFLLSSHHHHHPTTTLLLSAISSCSSKLLSLKFLAGPVSLSSIVSLSNSCTQLRSLSITLSRPIFLNWVSCFPCLKELSIVFCYDEAGENFFQNGVLESEDFDVELSLQLGLESLCFEGIRGDDWGIDWLWKRCRNLKILKLLSCQGIGGSYSSFVNCLQGVRQIELKTCRSVVDVVLLKLSEHCNSLESFLVHDGGSRDSLLHFISHCRSVFIFIYFITVLEEIRSLFLKVTMNNIKILLSKLIPLLQKLSNMWY